MKPSLSPIKNIIEQLRKAGLRNSVKGMTAFYCGMMSTLLSVIVPSEFRPFFIIVGLVGVVGGMWRILFTRD
jgi:hypothetical protein